MKTVEVIFQREVYFIFEIGLEFSLEIKSTLDLLAVVASCSAIACPFLLSVRPPASSTCKCWWLKQKRVPNLVELCWCCSSTTFYCFFVFACCCGIDTVSCTMSCCQRLLCRRRDRVWCGDFIKCREKKDVFLWWERFLAPLFTKFFLFVSFYAVSFF